LRKSVAAVLFIAVLALALAAACCIKTYQQTTATETSVTTTTRTITRPSTLTLATTSSFPAEVFFSPHGGCMNQVVHWIDSANSSVHVLIYSFTLDEVGKALVSALHRGIDVKVVFEKDQISQHNEYGTLRAVGVPVKNDTNSALMHDKIAIVDGNIVLTGSYNWSSAAEERNNENLLVIRDPTLAQRFEAEFQKIWRESVG